MYSSCEGLPVEPDVIPQRSPLAQVSYEYRYDENGAAGSLTSTIDSDHTARLQYNADGALKQERLEVKDVSGMPKISRR